MRPRKNEVEAMVALLDREADDIDVVAKQALTLAWDLAAQRKRFGVVIYQPGVSVTCHGPFETVNQADRFLTTFVGAGPDPARVLVVPMNGADDDTTEGLF